jgi:hypothetical protein
MLANWRRKLGLKSKTSSSRLSGGRGLKPRRFIPQVLLLEDRLVPSNVPGAAGVFDHLTVDGYPNTTAGTSQTFLVEADDSLGNPVTTYTGTVHFASTDPSAVLPADYTFNAGDAGDHSFAATFKTAGTQTLKADDISAPTTIYTQTGIVISPAAANHFTLAGVPSSVAAGSAQTITATALDQFNNVATGYRGTTQLTSSDAQATLPGLYAFTATDNGVHAFSVSLKTLGAQSISIKDVAHTTITGTESGITVTPAAAATFTVTGFPSPINAGTAGSFTVTAKDQFGNTATGYVGTVHFTSSDAQASLPGNYIFNAGDAGIHTFSATLKTAGTKAITGTDTVTGSITGSQTGITVNGLTTIGKFAVSGFAGGAAPDTSNVTVTAEDQFGNAIPSYTGTVTFTSSDAQAGLPANYAFTGSGAGLDNGVHTFSATLKTAGSQSISTKDTVTTSATGSQSGITVTAGQAASLAFTGLGASTTAGAGTSLTVIASDAFGNKATGYTGTVHFAMTDGAGTTPANYTFTALDAGQHLFTTAVFRTVGAQSISVNDVTTVAINATQSTNVTAGAFNHFKITGFAGGPSPDTSSFVVTQVDAFGNTTTSYTGTMHFTSSDGAAVLPANYKFVGADLGSHTFTATLNTAGTQSITATDTIITSQTGSQTGIVVTASATVAKFAVAGFPSPSTAGAPGTFTVTAQDSGGNLVSTYTGTVTFSSSDPGAVLPANYTFVAGDNGVHTFTAGATLKKSGSQTITATDTTTATITGSETVSVVASTAVTMTMTGLAASTAAGASNTVTVVLFDQFGNRASGYRGVVHFTSSDAQAVIPANYLFTATDAGAHVFGPPVSTAIQFKTAGAQTITATDTVTATLTASQSTTVTAGAVSKFKVAGFTGGASPDTSNFTVTAQDAFGNTATNYVGSVHFTSSDGLATLPVNYTYVIGDAGIHTFSATLKTAGSQSITATDTATATITGSQTGIAITSSGVVTNLLVSGFPTTQTAGVAGNIIVRARDASNNTVTSYTGTVSFAVSGVVVGETVPANYTFVAGDNGVHTFTSGVTLTKAGSRTLSATDTTTTSITGSQTTTIVAAAAASMTATGPATATAGTPITVTVKLFDTFANPATSYRGQVQLTSTDGAATLPAAYTFAAVDAGTHVFSVTLKTASGGTTVTSTDVATPTLTATTGPIAVSASTAAGSFTVTGFAGGATPDSSSFTVSVKDSFGNAATGYLGTISFLSSDGAATLRGNYTFNVGDAGTHTFASGDIILRTVGTQSISVRDTSTLVTGSETGIVITAGTTVNKFAVSGFPTSIVAGNSGTFIVKAQDSVGNTVPSYTGTVNFTTSDAQGSFAPTSYTFVGADNGVHTFTNGATLKTAGSQSITATDSLTASITGSQTGITVTSATVNSLTMTGSIGGAAGNARSLTVKLFDAFNNLATTYRGQVHFTSSDAAATLPANYTFAATDAGQHVFSVTLKTAGSQSVTVTDTSTASLTATVTGTVTGGTIVGFKVTGIPSPVTSGATNSLTVRAVDAFGNTAGYTATVHFTSTDAQAVLPANYTFTALDAGQHIFSGVVLKTAGTQSITARDTIITSEVGSQTGISVVSSGVVTQLSVTGFPSPSAAGAPGSVTVTAKDGSGNLVTGYLGTVHFTSSDGAATLPADYTFVSGDNGAHTFTGGVTLVTAGTQSISATDTVTNSITGSQSVTVTAGAAATMATAGYPASTSAGVAHGITVKLTDSFGNKASSYRGTITLSSSDGNATLTAIGGTALPTTYTFTATDAGQHVFQVVLGTPGAQSIGAVDNANATLTSTQTGISVTAGATAKFAVGGFVGGASPDTSTFTVTAQDAYGNLTSGYVGTVKFATSDAQGTVPGNYTFLLSDNGVHSFPATLKTAGTQSITVTDTVTATIKGTQTGIVIGASGTVAKLIVSGFPATQTAGVAGSLIVKAEDAASNIVTTYTGTVNFAVSGAVGGETIPGPYTFVGADNGVHTFTNGVTLTKAGSRTITATDNVTTSITGSQTTSIVAAAAASMSATGFPNPAASGVAGNITVVLSDAFGNQASGYRGTVQFTSSDGGASLPANYTYTATDAGKHIFSVTLNTTGSQSITATDVVTPALSATQTVTVNAGTVGSFNVTGFNPNPITAGSGTNTFTVSALDTGGHAKTDYLGTIHFTSSDAAATLPTDYTFTVADNGTHTFTNAVVFKTAATQRLSVNDTSTTTAKGTETGIVVQSTGVTAKFTVSGFPSPTVAGTAGTFVVKALDSFGNAVTGYLGTVNFTTSDTGAGAGFTPSSYAFQAADNGVHTFTNVATLVTAGSQSITASDATTPTITGSQTGITVTASNTTQMTVSGSTSVTAGNGASITVVLKDQFGNKTTAYRGTVHLASSDPAAVVPANYTFLATDAGQHVFSVTLKTAGSQTVTVNDTTTASINGTQTVTVNAAGINHFSVTGFPSGPAGTTGSVTVKAVDAFGNRTGYLATVHFTSSDAQASLPANYTFVAADAGQHIFSGVVLRTAGTQSITARDTIITTEVGSQTGIAITASATTAALQVTGFPSPSTAGAAGTFVVSAVDSFGNPTTGYLGTVHFTSSDGAASLPANYTFVGADNGVHTFTAGATLKTAGSQSITATDTVTGTITGSQTVTVAAATAATLTASGYPANTAAGVSNNLTVVLTDAFGNLAKGYRGTVTVSSSDAQVTPFTYTFTATDGGVHAIAVKLKTVSASTSITATDTVTPALTSTQSGIIVTPGVIAQYQIVGLTNTVAGVGEPAFTITAMDAFGNTKTDYVGTIHFAATGTSTLPANYTFLAADAGVHTFASGSIILKTAGTQSVTVNDTAITAAKSSVTGLVITPAAAKTLTVTGFPTSVAAGTNATFTVTAKDAFGNVATAYNGTVQTTLSDPSGIPPANYTFIAADNGKHVFTAQFQSASTSNVITVTDTAHATITGKQTGITVTPGAASALIVSPSTTNATHDVAFQVVVTVVDAFGNVVTGYLGTVHFSLSSANAGSTLPANYQFTAADAGSHIFNVTLHTPGTTDVLANDVVTPAINGDSGPITVASATLDEIFQDLGGADQGDGGGQGDSIRDLLDLPQAGTEVAALLGASGDTMSPLVESVAQGMNSKFTVDQGPAVSALGAALLGGIWLTRTTEEEEERARQPKRRKPNQK